MFKRLNESFHKKYFKEASSAKPEVDSLSDLRRSLLNAVMCIFAGGRRDVKSFEIALQDVIEQYYPDKSWWEVTSYHDIFKDMMSYTLENGKLDANIMRQIIDNIIEGIHSKNADVEIKESKKLRKNKKSLKESFAYDVYDTCDGGTVTIYDGYEDPDAGDGYWVALNHPEEDFGQVEIGCYKTKDEAKKVAEKAMELIRKSYDSGELTFIYDDYNTDEILERIARIVLRKFPDINENFKKSKKQRNLNKSVKSLKEAIAPEDSEVLNKTIKVYDLNTLIDKEVNDGSREEEYETFHFGDGAAIIVTSKGDGCVLDYEAVGQSFDTTSDTVDIYLCPKSRDDGKGHRTFSIMPTARAEFTVDELLKAPSKDVKVKDFFYKWNYNPRCQRNFEDIVHYLTESSKLRKRSKSLRESSIPEDDETFYRQKDLLLSDEEFADDDIVEETISDKLSDEYGFCHNGFEWKRVKDGSILVWNIKWDLDESLKESSDVTDQIVIDIDQPGFITKKHELQDKGYKVIWVGNRKICLAKPKQIGESKKRSRKNKDFIKESANEDRIKQLKNELADIQKSLKNGENPDRLDYRKNKIINELQRLGCDNGWFEYVSESIDDGDKPFSIRKMEKELKDGGVFDKDRGFFLVGFKEEKEHCKKILDRKGFEYEVSLDDRTNPPYYHFEYWKKSLKTESKKPVEKPQHITNESFGDDIRIYMNTWSNYNENGADLSRYGINSIKDGWLTVDEAIEFCEEHSDDEPFINDTDNVPFAISEYDNAYEVLQELQELQSSDADEDIVAAVIEATGCDIGEAVSIVEDGDYYWYPGVNTESDLAYAVIDEIGGLEEAVGDKINDYIDEDMMRRDYEYDVRDMLYEEAEDEVEKEHRFDDEDEYDKDQEIEDYIDEHLDSYLDSIIREEIALAEMGEVDLSDYFDYEAYGRDLTFDDYTFVDGGCICVLR